MTTESTENKTAEELAAEEIIAQAEEQVEAQLENAQEAVSPELEKINELELALAAAQATVLDQKDAVVRAKAEVDNIRRRSAQDVDKAHKFALEKFAADLLPVLDNLERSLGYIDRDNEAVKALAAVSASFRAVRRRPRADQPKAMSSPSSGLLCPKPRWRGQLWALGQRWVSATEKIWRCGQCFGSLGRNL